VALRPWAIGGARAPMVVGGPAGALVCPAPPPPRAGWGGPCPPAGAVVEAGAGRPPRRRWRCPPRELRAGPSGRLARTGPRRVPRASGGLRGGGEEGPFPGSRGGGVRPAPGPPSGRA
jgi:hypothetical protein